MSLPQLDTAAALRRLNPHVRLLAPEVALGQLADVAESVQIAEALALPAQAPSSFDSSALDSSALDSSMDAPTLDDGRWLLSHLQSELRSLQRWLDRRIAEPFSGRSPLPAWAETRARRLAGEHDDAGGIAAWAASLLAILRREIKRLRQEAAQPLRALARSAARLERLDAAPWCH